MFKKFVSILLVLVMLTGLSACGSTSSTSSSTNGKKKYKIGIMTSTVSQSEDEYRTAQKMKQKYGDMIVVQTYPDKVQEQETTISNALSLASDPDVKAIVFCQAQQGTAAAIDKIKKIRPDILTICGGFVDDVAVIGNTADICVTKDSNGMGDQLADGAKEMGATTFVHYSFPRHMAIQLVKQRTDILRARCKEIGLKFVEVTAPDPMGDSGTAGTQQFILEDVPREVQKYGKNTAFFGTNVAMNEAMIKSVVEQGAIYVMQSDPSPFNGYPEALGIPIPDDKKGDADYCIGQIRQKVAAKGETGRISSWGFATFPMFITSGVEYARAYLDGKTNGKVDSKVLQEKFNDYAKSNVTMTNYVDNTGKKYNGVFLILGKLVKF